MNHDIGYFDLETCRVEPLDNPYGPKVLIMCPVWTFATRHDGTVRRSDVVFAMPATNPILFVQ
jgi:hypothetical protein